MYNVPAIMGTIIWYKNVRIMIHSDDHLPPHVHAVGPGAEAKIEIETQKVIWAYGYQNKTLIRITEEIRNRQEELLEAWHEIHGKEKI
jgi:Domain of unknown function (DUF4160)